MQMNYTNITAEAKATLVGKGFKPDDVPFGGTGVGALELIIDAIAQAVVNEITTNAIVSTTVTTTVTGTLPTGPVAANGSGAGSGSIS